MSCFVASAWLVAAGSGAECCANWSSALWLQLLVTAVVVSVAFAAVVFPVVLDTVHEAKATTAVDSNCNNEDNMQPNKRTTAVRISHTVFPHFNTMLNFLAHCRVCFAACSDKDESDREDPIFTFLRPGLSGFETSRRNVCGQGARHFRLLFLLCYIIVDSGIVVSRELDINQPMRIVDDGVGKWQGLQQYGTAAAIG